jgi:hypothetical protein
MKRRRQQVIENRRMRGCPVGCDLYQRDPRRADGPLEEPARRHRVPPWRDEHVDDLAELVDGPVDVAPLPSNLGVGLVDLPAVPDGVPAGPGGVGQQRREALNPALDGGVVDLNPAFGGQYLDMAIRQREAQAPADRQHDDLRREGRSRRKPSG